MNKKNNLLTDNRFGALTGDATMEGIREVANPVMTPSMGGRISRGLNAVGGSIKKNPNTTAYFLGRAAQAVMGPFQDTSAALAGGLGAEMAQGRAYTRAMKEVLAGKPLESVEDASILTPQQQMTIMEHAEKVGARKEDTEIRRNEFDLAVKRLRDSNRNAAADRLLEERRLKLAENTTMTPEQKRKLELDLLDKQYENDRRLSVLRGRIAKETTMAGQDLEILSRIGSSLMGDLIQSGMYEDDEALLSAFKSGMNTMYTGLGKDAPFKVEEVKPEGEPTADTGTSKPEPKLKPFASQEEFDRMTRKTNIAPGDISGLSHAPFDQLTAVREKIPNLLKEGVGSSKDKPLVVPDASLLKDIPDGTYITSGMDITTGKPQIGLVKDGKILTVEETE